MAYTFKPHTLYRMPTHFGPSLGPRQGPEGRTFECVYTPKTTTVAVTYTAKQEQLEALLPPGFSVAKPLLNIYASYMTDIEWLAGRGYNVLGVGFPAIFQGDVDHVHGDFLTVLWENLADPIITGREDLGFSKVYCELPEPQKVSNGIHCTASWQGFKFFDLEVSELQRQSPEEIAALKSDSEGTLHYKYIPRTGDWGEADVAYATLTPSASPNRIVLERHTGKGKALFHKARWEDLPTLYTIVNTFEGLELGDCLAASVTRTVGAKDLSDQRILR